MTTEHERWGRNDGVALIIVLGLLAVLTILGVGFAIAMRVERAAAWNHANAVRAEQLVQAALVRAMVDVNQGMAGNVYPRWTNRPAARADVMGTDSGFPANRMSGLLNGEAARAIPPTLLPAANFVAANYCYWTNITVGGKTNGRIAYIVVNASGGIDANYAGGQRRDWSTNLAEIDPSCILSGAGGTNTFCTLRNRHRRYETITELGKLNTALGGQVADFFTYSLDVGRDQFFPMQNPTDLTALQTLGRPDAILSNKFNINSIATRKPDGSYLYRGYTQSWDYTAYTADPSFMSNYYTPLRALLTTVRSAGGTLVERPDDVAWNIINYIDPDRIPQGEAGVEAWTHSEGGEAMPIINEIVLRPSSNRPPAAPASGSNYYEFAVECWYPFAPTIVQPSDKFSLWVGVFTNHWNGTGNEAATPDSLTITNFACTNYTFTTNILNMAYSTPTEFFVATSPASKLISFPVVACVTDKPIALYVTNYLPIGNATYTDCSSGTPTNCTVLNRVWFLSRVYKTETQYYPSLVVWNLPVDEAMGYLKGSGSDAEGYATYIAPENQRKRQLREFVECRGYSVDDPRSNGQIKYWRSDIPSGGGGFIGGRDYAWNDAANCTLGKTNVNCDPWSRKGSGLPIYSTNGPMANIGELGYIWRSNLDDEQPPGYKWWRTINLMHYDEGAALLDSSTVRPTNASAFGLFCINSRQTNAIRALLYGMKVGYVSGSDTNLFPIQPADMANLVNAIIANGPYINFRSMFTSQDADDGGGGPLAAAFRQAGIGSDPQARGDVFGEDPFRRVCELITFRQNIFVMVLAAQVFGADGQTVVGERRATATIYRDSYTGRYFIRSFKWLSDV